MKREAQAIERIRVALAAAEDAGPREDCPPAERLWQAAAGELSPADTGEVVDHLAGCLLCGRLWEVARELQGGAEAVPERSHVPAERAEGPVWRRYGQLAAALALVAAGLYLALLLRGLPDGGTSEFRGTEGFEVVLEAPSRLPREDFVLRWNEGPPGFRFDVRVVRTSEDRQVVVDRAEGLEESRYRVPPERLEGIPPGSRLRCTVEARHRGAVVSLRSRTILLE